MNNSVKPWGGRFKEGTDRKVEQFTQSIHFDRRLFRYDIEGSLAHARMLGKQGIISLHEEQSIRKGLNAIRKEMEAGSFVFDVKDEDIHMAIEKALIQKIGKPGEKLHTGRSRNDQVVLDVRLYLRAEIKNLLNLLKYLKKELVEAAKREKTTIMPGYTHLQKAQPILLSHYLLSFWEMFDRDEQRFKECLKRVNVMPLGAAALAGTSLPLDRNYVARLLKFPAVSRNSMDTVADRDFITEFIFSASVVMMHMSRFCEDMVIWSSSEFHYIEISDTFTTGSSIMPQKKNPDVAELIRGKTGRVYGHLMAMLTILKGLPMTYNRDLQEDKEPLFDAVDTVSSSVEILAGMLSQITFQRERMAEEAGKDFPTATDIAEYLVQRGIAFREAHGIVGRIVEYCIDNRKELTDLILTEFMTFHSCFDEDVIPRLQPANSVDMRKTIGGTALVMVEERIRDIEKGS